MAEGQLYTVEVRLRADQFIAAADGRQAVGLSPGIAVLRLAGKLGITNGSCRIERIQQLERGCSVWEVCHV